MTKKLFHNFKQIDKENMILNNIEESSDSIRGL